jgi:hypothetical protein
MLHMIKKRLLPLLLVLSMTGVCLAGCGNGSSEPASTNPPGAEAETENSGAAETMEAAEEAEEEEEEYLSDIPEEERERLEAAAASDETWTVMLYLAGSDLEENGSASDNACQKSEITDREQSLIHAWHLLRKVPFYIARQYF